MRFWITGNAFTESNAEGLKELHRSPDNGNLYEACHFLCYRASVPEERDMEGGSICVAIGGRP